MNRETPSSGEVKEAIEDAFAIELRVVDHSMRLLISNIHVTASKNKPGGASVKLQLLL